MVTLPYTGALALAFLFLLKSKEHTYGKFMISGVILLGGFWLGAALHRGITDAESAAVNQQMLAANHPWGHPAAAGPQAMMNDLRVLSAFYYKFGAPLFVGGTLAAFVLAWNMMRWIEKDTVEKPADSEPSG